MAKTSAVIIRPQAGPQEDFLSTSADIAIYGGSAGGGKSYALLLEALRHKDNPRFGAVIFRRTSKQVMDEGGLWDTASELYPHAGGEPSVSRMKWNFESGAAITFAHMEHEKNKLDWQGSQIPYIGFDELTHFSKSQFTYMFSRNRSTCGVRPYIRGTCNPDPQSWVKELISWYLDADKRFPDPAKAGKLRYFLVIKGDFKFTDTREELEEKYPALKDFILTFTFIPAKLEDNPILRSKDPMYEAKLMAMGETDAAQLRSGDWSASENIAHFREEYFQYYDELPDERDVLAVVSSWDTASKKGQENDYTAGTTWWIVKNKEERTVKYYLRDIVIEKFDYPGLKKAVKDNATTWRPDEILIEDQSSGIALAQEMQSDTEWNVVPIVTQGTDKIGRAMYASDFFSRLLVMLPRFHTRLEKYKNCLLQFPLGEIKDPVDSTSQFFKYVQNDYEPERRVDNSDEVGYIDAYSGGDGACPVTGY